MSDVQTSEQQQRAATVTAFRRTGKCMGSLVHHIHTIGQAIQDQKKREEFYAKFDKLIPS